MYKVFINDKALFFAQREVNNNCISFIYEGISQLERIISDMESGVITDEVCLVTSDVAEMKRDFSSFFTYIEAAGGIIRNKEDKVLFIYRLGKWDLPKGKLEEGETPETGAVREVEEEVNLHAIQIVKELSSTFHTYIQQEKRILKRTYWFEMLSTLDEPIRPQTEEGITAVEWIKKEEIDRVLTNTYNSIKSVVEEFLEKN